MTNNCEHVIIDLVATLVNNCKGGSKTFSPELCPMKKVEDQLQTGLSVPKYNHIGRKCWRNTRRLNQKTFLKTSVIFLKQNTEKL